VRSALLHLPGVDCVHVDLHGGFATVACDGPCDREALVKALKRVNYGATFR
jgi:hypothetical protein